MILFVGILSVNNFPKFFFSSQEEVGLEFANLTANTSTMKNKAIEIGKGKSGPRTEDKYDL